MPPPGAFPFVIFWVALPVLILMAVWAAVTAYRILAPDEPMDPVVLQKHRERLRGTSAVRLRDILDDERARHLAASAPGDEPGPRPSPLFDDLWLRRN